MNRIEFINRLEALLQDLPKQEREDAIAYYHDYFDDAGVENEQDVIASLGSPEKVAATIKAVQKDEDRNEGEFSETGFYGYEDITKDEIISKPRAEQERKVSKNDGMLVLLITTTLTTIYIPAGTMEAYSIAQYWSDYTDKFVEMS